MHRLTAASRTRTPHNQALHITMHIRVPVRQPHPHARGQRDHRRTAAITRRNATKADVRAHPDAGAVRQRDLDPLRRGRRRTRRRTSAGAGWLKTGKSLVICTGMNTGTGLGASTPLRTCARQFHSRPRLTACRRATAANDAPGCSTSATIRSFSSRRQRRRRPTPVMISIQIPAPILTALIQTPLRSPARVTDARRCSPDGYGRAGTRQSFRQRLQVFPRRCTCRGDSKIGRPHTHFARSRSSPDCPLSAHLPRSAEQDTYGTLAVVFNHLASGRPGR